MKTGHKKRTTRGARDIFDAIERECSALGLRRPIVVTGGRHDKLVIEIDGHEHFLPMPLSKSCPRAHKNARADLRRLVRRVREGAQA